MPEVPTQKGLTEMTIKAKMETLSVEREEALEKAKTLLTEAEASAEGLTDAIATEIDELTETARVADESIKALLARDKAIQAKLQAMSGFEDHTASINNARGIHIDAKPDDGQRQQTANTVPATVRRYGKLTAFQGTHNGVHAEERAYRFGQWALAKLQADMPQRFRFPNASQFARDQFGFDQFAVHGSGSSDTTGAGVFVPDEFGTDLIALREVYGVARSVFKVRPMSSDTRTDPRRKSGLSAYFVGENDAGTESNGDWDQVSLTARDLMCISRMSNQLNEDSVIDFGNTLAEEISIAFAQKEDDCAFNGTGTSTYGGITGLRTQLATLTAATTTNGLIQAAGSTWASITLTNLNYMVAALPVYANIPGQVYWICNSTFFWQVMVPLLNAVGGTTPTDIQGGKSPMFLGFPVRFSQVYPGSTASGQIPVTLGNYMQCGSFGDRRQETISFSDSATVGGQSMWERNQIGVKGTERFDVKIHDFGTDTTLGPVTGLETQ